MHQRRTLLYVGGNVFSCLGLRTLADETTLAVRVRVF